ncbi:MAG: ABC transporter ATP-binding protein [Dehalococcoidia bacterium]
MRILEGEKVSKYFGGLAAVSNVDFHIDEGEIFGLIGPNGAGKTTLFNLVSGALDLKSGVIKFRSEEISGLSPYQICRRGIARTFQSVKIFPNMSVRENVLLGDLFGNPQSGTWVADRSVDELLDFVGLSGMGTVPAGDLTLVNQKRLEVAAALSAKPELVMLDELMAGLTSTETAETMELVADIRRRGITVLIIEHVMKAVMGVCDRVMVLHHGEKLAEGTPQEISTSKRVIEVYLGE